MTWSFTTPSADTLWELWRARYIGAGVDPIVIRQLEAAIDGWDDWCPKWHAVARETEEWAERSLQAGNTLTAGELFTRASILYHFGGMMVIDDMDLFHESHRRCVEAYAKGAPLLKVPGQPVKVPFQGIEMPGYLRVPRAEVPPPVAVFVNGWEGRKEESGMNVEHMLDRGVATFSFDGPGIGEVLPHLPMTGEYGPALNAVYDTLSQRDDIDPDRIALVGISRGAFLAAKAAAEEPRAAALAMVGPGYVNGMLHLGDDLKSLIGEYMQFIFHQDSPEALEERLAAGDLDLEGVGQRITCPTLVVTDDHESEAQYGGSVRLHSELASTEKTLAVVSGAQRNGLARVYIVRPLVADWVANTLGAAAP